MNNERNTGFLQDLVRAMDQLAQRHGIGGQNAGDAAANAPTAGEGGQGPAPQPEVPPAPNNEAAPPPQPQASGNGQVDDVAMMEEPVAPPIVQPQPQQENCTGENSQASSAVSGLIAYSDSSEPEMSDDDMAGSHLPADLHPNALDLNIVKIEISSEDSDNSEEDHDLELFMLALHKAKEVANKENDRAAAAAAGASTSTASSAPPLEVLEGVTKQEGQKAEAVQEPPLDRPSYLQLCVICDLPADFVCQGCFRSAYCSSEHQLANWQDHRSHCVNFALARSPSLIYRGPFLIDSAFERVDKPVVFRLKANAKLAAQQKLLEEKPLLMCPWPRLKTRFTERQVPPGLQIRNLNCFGCGKTLCFNYHRCPDCKLFLCSPDCLYLTQHKSQECQLIQQLPGEKTGKNDTRLDLKAMQENAELREFLYMDIMILRLILKFDQMRHEMTPEQFANEWARLDIIWRTCPLPSPSTLNERHAKILKNLELYFGYSITLLRGNVHLFWKLFSIIDMNSFPFELPFRRFRALCQVIQLAGHNCTPNSHAFIREPEIEKMDINQLEEDPNELTIVLQSVRPIFDQGVITISYVPLIYGTVDRHCQLLSTHLLLCKCGRCLDPTEGGTYATNIKCPTCQIAMMTPKSSLVDKTTPDNASVKGNALVRPVWECKRGQLVGKTVGGGFSRLSPRLCPTQPFDDSMKKLMGVETAMIKLAVENISGMKDVLITSKMDGGYLFQSAMVKMSEDVIRGTFCPLPDVTSDDLNEYSDEMLIVIVLAKKLFGEYMRKINPGFNFEGYPIANLELAENELMGRESGKAKWLEALSLSTAARMRSGIRIVI